MNIFVPKPMAVVMGALCVFGAVASQAATPQNGGELNIVVGSKIPSYDGHIESTFGMIHPIKPFYSGLIRVNPDNPSSPTDFVCDVCVGDIPEPTEGSTKYTFKIRTGITFHDGTPMTSADVKATFDKIVFPPEGIVSNRKAYFNMVGTITAPDPETLVFKLKHPSGTFIPSVAMPFNFIYSKKDLDTHGYTWHQQNINGTGAFKFVEHIQGSHVKGARNDSYHHAGKPYIRGFTALAAPKMSVRLQAIRGGRADIEFRGFPPKARDDLVKALGDKVTVQESDWNCGIIATPNHQMKPFDDPRVRRALTLAIDRHGGSKYLSEIAIVKTVGGIVFPNHPLAASMSELKENIAGYSDDTEGSIAEAKALLAEAGHSDLEFTLLNRAVDQPYKVIGTWVIGQWKKIGVKVKQDVRPTTPWYASLRKTRDFDVAIDANCQSVVNPISDVSKYLPSASSNYSYFEDEELERLYTGMQQTANFEEQKILMRKYEKRVLNDLTSQMFLLWWYKINVHRSYVKGWKIAPSHYLNQSLDNNWIDQDEKKRQGL